MTADIREMVNACLYLHKTGCQWRYLPQDFGAWQTVRSWHDRFASDGVWAEASGLLLRGVRRKAGRKSEPATAILDAQSVASGPQQGERGFDGKRLMKGVKRHVLTCSMGLVLAVPVTQANLHDSQAAGRLLACAKADGWRIERVVADAGYRGAPVRAAARLHGVDMQVGERAPGLKGFKPEPLRWRIEATFGTQTTCYRRLTRNLERSNAAAENAVEVANFSRILKAYCRS